MGHAIGTNDVALANLIPDTVCQRVGREVDHGVLVVDRWPNGVVVRHVCDVGVLLQVVLPVELGEFVLRAVHKV